MQPIRKLFTSTVFTAEKQMNDNGEITALLILKYMVPHVAY